MGRCLIGGVSIHCPLYDNSIDTESIMTTVTISPKFQVVIPKRIRERLDLRPGQQVQVVEYGDRVEVTTAHGRCRANYLVIGCNAYLNELNPELGGKVLPAGSPVAWWRCGCCRGSRCCACARGHLPSMHCRCCR